MPATARRWTAQEVRALIADARSPNPRYELVDGELLVTPGPSRWHQAVVVELLGELRAYLQANPIGRVLTSPSDVELEPDFLTQPDVYVVPNDHWRALGRNPVIASAILVIEVLSPDSSRSRSRSQAPAVPASRPGILDCRSRCAPCRALAPW